MSKAVLISIKPEWCGMIALGEKTIEVRKTRPKLETPFKCYIYCTLPKGSGDIWLIGGEKPVQGNGKVIGEFVCDEIIKYPYNRDGYGLKDEADIIAKSCVPEKELYHYLQGATPYGWHISNLVIYDKPKDLTDFFVEGECYPPRCSECKYFDAGNGYNVEDDCLLPHHLNEEGNDVKPLKRPPQSWCYVEEIS